MVIATIVGRESIRATETAELVPVDKSFISRLVQQIYEKQLVSRRRSLTDRRTATLWATTAYEELLLQLVQPLHDLEREMVWGMLEKDLHLAVSVIAAVTGNLEEVLENRT